MDSVKFAVQGSALDPYEVTIFKDDSKIRGACNCAAGARLQSCKHVIRILKGMPDDIVSGVDFVTIVADWLAGSALENILQDVDHAEQQLEIVKAALSVAKRNLAKELNE